MPVLFFFPVPAVRKGYVPTEHNARSPTVAGSLDSIATVQLQTIRYKVIVIIKLEAQTNLRVAHSVDLQVCR